MKRFIIICTVGVYTLLTSSSFAEKHATCTSSSSVKNSHPTITNLEGYRSENNRVTLSWISTRNESINHIEIEKSSDGKDFTTVGLVFTSEREGIEKYNFKGLTINSKKTYYRLKIHCTNSEVRLSNVVVFRSSGI